MRTVRCLPLAAGLSLALAAHALAETAIPVPPRAPVSPEPGSDQARTLATAISACWTVDALPPEARAGTVTLAVRLDDAGRPDPASIRRIAASGAAPAMLDQLEGSAIRALIRCGASGLDHLTEEPIPRDLELTFAPMTAVVR